MQDSAKLHMKNKLCAAHVYFSKNKMKVKLAAQLISNSVADAIEYCQYKLNLPNFNGSEGTVQFLRIFNDLFDVLNSQNIHSFRFKKAVSKVNVPDILKFVEEADE